MAENEDQNEDISEIRRKLEEANALNKTLTSDNAQLRQQSAIKDSGLKLSDRQSKVVLRELADSETELTADAYKQVAQELGFGQTQTPPANDQPKPEGETPPTPNGQGSESENDEEIMVSLAEMSTIDRANYHARRGLVNKDLDTQMREAKTPEELTSIIRKHGPASGLVHEHDTQ